MKSDDEDENPVEEELTPSQKKNRRRRAAKRRRQQLQKSLQVLQDCEQLQDYYDKFRTVTMQMTPRSKREEREEGSKQRSLQSLDQEIFDSMLLHLKQVTIFEKASDSFLVAIINLLVPRVFDPNELIIEEGDEGNEMYFLLKGQVQAERASEVICIIEEGAFFGELALILDHYRMTSSMRAKSLVNLLMLTKEALASVFQSFPDEKDVLEELAHSTMLSMEAKEYIEDSSSSKMEVVLKKALGEKNREIFELHKKLKSLESELKEANRKVEMMGEIMSDGQESVSKKISAYQQKSRQKQVTTSCPSFRPGTGKVRKPTNSPPPIRISSVPQIEGSRAPRKHYRTKKPMVPAINSNLLEQIRSGKKLSASEERKLATARKEETLTSRLRVAMNVRRNWMLLDNTPRTARPDDNEEEWL